MEEGCKGNKWGSKGLEWAGWGWSDGWRDEGKYKKHKVRN